jgi:NAD(P)-dependent dehydrogenase (short-subunit alcohol dehydrogenase family)
MPIKEHRESTVLITGSSDGIGKATAVELARRGHRVIVHGRTPARAEAARNEVLRESQNGGAAGQTDAGGKNPGGSGAGVADTAGRADGKGALRPAGSAQVEAVAADLASLQEVRSLAAAIRARFERLDVLINNAGVYVKRRQESREGYELTFAVNHLAHFLLTLKLLDLLKAGAPSRIVVVSSMTHSSGGLDLEDLQMRRGYDGYSAYCRSKLANLLFTYALARRLEGTGVTVNALHPGVIATKLLHANFSGGSPVERGAQTPVYLATAPEVVGVTGRYFVDRREARSSPESHNRELQEQLWRLSEKLVGLATGAGRKES